MDVASLVSGSDQTSCLQEGFLGASSFVARVEDCKRRNRASICPALRIGEGRRKFRCEVRRDQKQEALEKSSRASPRHASRCIHELVEAVCQRWVTMYLVIPTALLIFA